MEINKFQLFSLSLVLILGVAKSFDYHWQELESEEAFAGMYDRWRDHHKVAERSPQRFNVFKENVRMIHNHNKMNKPYKLKVNHFAAMTRQEFMETYGSSKPRHYRALHGPRVNTNLKGIYDNVDVNSLPKRWDWREHNAVGPVKSQGQCGSCFAFAAVGAIEGINAIRTGELKVLSEQVIMDCDTTGRTGACDGGLVCGVFKWVKEHQGLALSEAYPYVGKKENCCSKKFGKYLVTVDGVEYLPTNVEGDVLKAVANQPVVVMMDPNNDAFMFYAEGIYTGPCGLEINHAMLVVGYDETPDGQQYWIVKNSWGEGWGEQGYVRLARGLPMPEGICGMYIQPDIPLKSPETKNIIIP